MVVATGDADVVDFSSLSNMNAPRVNIQGWWLLQEASKEGIRYLGMVLS